MRRRRLASVSAVAVGAVGLTVLAPVWVPLAAVADLARLHRRLPTVRLLALAAGWCWLEVIGVARALGLWVRGRARDLEAHYQLQRWWVGALTDVMRCTVGLRIDSPDAAVLRPGPVVLLCRHASLADSIVSAWVTSAQAGLNPHYVLKRELLAVPNLDVVGHRLPNVFVDREAADSAGELDAIRRVAARLGRDDVMVIFPEGTRASPAKRERILARIAQRDPARAQRLAGLRHLIPPRPAGTMALLEGAPDADVVLAWHAGLDGLHSFPAIHRALRRGRPVVTFRMERIARADVPTDGLVAWLDDRWLELDRRVDGLPEALP